MSSSERARLKLHVVTAVTRPENLPRLAESLSLAVEQEPVIDVSWHWRFDLVRQHVGGQAVKNALLDGIGDGWVWVLDDDTAVHPGLFPVFADTLDRLPELRALVVSQRRSDGRVLHAARENVRVGEVDIGQALLRRDLIGDLRLPEHYEGDGVLLETLLRDEPAAVFTDAVLSYHNALDGSVATAR